MIHKNRTITTKTKPFIPKWKLLLLGNIPGTNVAKELPSLDEELMLRAAEAFTAENFLHSCHLLEAIEDDAKE